MPAGAKDQKPLPSDQLTADRYESAIQTNPAAGRYTYSYTEYDADGLIIRESWSDGKVTHYDYSGPATQPRT